MVYLPAGSHRSINYDMREWYLFFQKISTICQCYNVHMHFAWKGRP